MFASEVIEEGMVGPYSGLVLHDKEIDTIIRHPRQLLACLHFWYSFSDFVGFDYSLFPSFENPMAMINDFCGPDRSVERKESLEPPNCCYMAAKVRNEK